MKFGVIASLFAAILAKKHHKKHHKKHRHHKHHKKNQNKDVKDAKHNDVKDARQVAINMVLGDSEMIADLHLPENFPEMSMEEQSQLLSQFAFFNDFSDKISKASKRFRRHSRRWM